MKKGTLWNRNFILINLCVIFASFTNFAYIYILPVHMLNVGGSNTAVGIMGAGLTIMGIITRLTMAPLIDTWGRKKMLLLGVILFALNSLGYYALQGSVTGIIIMRCVSGFSQGIFFPVPPTIVSDVVSEDKLVDGLGIFGVASYMPAILSPVVGMYLYDNIGHSMFFAVTLVMTVISIVFALLYKDAYVPQKKTDTNRSRGIGSVLELSIILPCLMSILIMFGNSAVTNFAIPYGNAQSIANMSIFFTVNNLVIVIVRLLTGRLRKYISVGKLMMTGIIVLGAGNLLVAFAMNLPLMLTASIMIGAGMTFYAQLNQANILLKVSDSRRGVANSTLMLAEDIGTGAGAAAFGLVSEHIGYMVTFIMSAVVTWFALPIAARKKR